jgi:hypothetical protein
MQKESVRIAKVAVRIRLESACVFHHVLFATFLQDWACAQ